MTVRKWVCMSRFFTYFVLIFGALIFAIISLLLIYNGYDKVINTILTWLNNVKYEDRVKGLVSLEKFKIISYVFLGLSLVCIILLKAVSFIARQIAFCFLSLNNTLSRIWKSINEDKKVYFFLITPCCISIVMALWLPVSYDEAWTYINFTSKSFIASMTYYPAPNNHILHSILTNISIQIPFIDKLFLLRLPALFFSFVQIVLSFVLFKEFVNKRVAIIVLGIAFVLPMNIYYSYLSRGYELYSLMFLINTASIYSILVKGSKNRYWLYFTFSGIIGFYTIPSFLYPFVTNCLLLFILSPRNFKPLFKYGAVVCLVVIVLYLPIIIINGVNALVNNHFVEPITRAIVLEKMPHFIHEALLQIVGINPWIYLVLLVASLYIGKFYFDGKKILILAFYFVMPVLLMIGHSVIPFPRTFYYYWPILVFPIAYGLYVLLSKQSNTLVFAVVVILQVVIGMNGIKFILSESTKEVEYHSILNHWDYSKKVWINSNLFDTYLVYNQKMRGVSVDFLYYNLPKKVNVDTLKSDAKIYVVDKEFDNTVFKKPYFETDQTNFYK